jgi:hypothetical protein
MQKLGIRSALVVTFGLWALVVASRFNFNGLMFGFDYGLFHPDGSLYTFKTLTLMGQSQHDAALKVSDWYSQNAFKLTDIDPKSLYFNANPSWEIYGTRFIYPFLSIPFVSILGINGMLVIPALSFLVLVLGVLYIGRFYGRIVPALLVIMGLCISITVSRWMLINSTDSLLVALTTILTCMSLGKVRNRYWIPVTLVVIILGSFTRFSLFLWLAFAIVLFSNKQWVRGSLVSILSILCFVPTLFREFQSAVLPNSPDASLISKVVQLPVSMARVAFFDIAQLAALDRLLLFLIATATLIALFNWRSMSGRYLLASLFMLWCTAGVNGTPGVNFRYELPVLPIMSWVILEYWSKISKFISADTRTG